MHGTWSTWCVLIPGNPVRLEVSNWQSLSHIWLPEILPRLPVANPKTKTGCRSSTDVSSPFGSWNQASLPFTSHILPKVALHLSPWSLSNKTFERDVVHPIQLLNLSKHLLTCPACCSTSWCYCFCSLMHPGKSPSPLLHGSSLQNSRFFLLFLKYGIFFILFRNVHIYSEWLSTVPSSCKKKMWSLSSLKHRFCMEIMWAQESWECNCSQQMNS